MRALTLSMLLVVHTIAVECVRVLGVPEAEGVVRFGLVHYHSPDDVDVDRILQALADLRP